VRGRTQAQTTALLLELCKGRDVSRVQPVSRAAAVRGTVRSAAHDRKAARFCGGEERS
jgi:hypothetical protein